MFGAACALARSVFHRRLALCALPFPLRSTSDAFIRNLCNVDNDGTRNRHSPSIHSIGPSEAAAGAAGEAQAAGAVDGATTRMLRPSEQLLPEWLRLIILLYVSDFLNRLFLTKSGILLWYSGESDEVTFSLWIDFANIAVTYEWCSLSYTCKV